jgi:hypothetical protein
MLPLFSATWRTVATKKNKKCSFFVSQLFEKYIHNDHCYEDLNARKLDRKFLISDDVFTEVSRN